MEPDPLRGAHPSEPAEGGRDQGVPPEPRGGQVHPDDLRELLGADEAALLVLQEGRIRVVPGDYEGALEVISREDLAGRLGARADDKTALEEQAVLLNTEIRQLGA